MKTIIVPTDFSPAADNAMHYAAQLALMIEAGILLTHIYQIPVSMNDMPIVVVSADELRQNADEALSRCVQQLKNNYPDLPIQTESRLGDVNNELEDLCSHVRPETIVMGSHGASSIEHLFFGSTTLTAIRESTYPVIIVPLHYSAFSLKNVVMAVDLKDAQTLPAEWIMTFMQLLHVHVHVVHITNKDENSDVLNRDILLHKLEGLNPAFHDMYNENVKQGLEDYLKENQADLLLLFPHQHSLMDRLFFKHHTTDIIMHTTIPVMTIRC